MLTDALRKRIEDEVLHELGGGISPNKELVRAIRLTIDKILEMEGKL